MKYENFYSRFVELPSSQSAEVNVTCPFHDDNHPSMSINKEEGVWYCHACRIGGGPAHFYARLKGIPYRDAVQIVSEMIENGDPTIPEEVVDEMASLLHDEEGEQALSWLKARGISDEVIEAYKLGVRGTRIAIPVRDMAGRIVNVRLHSWTGQKGKVISWKGEEGQDFGKPRLFPVDQLSNDTILLVEGELDALAAISAGVPAISGTGGAQTWRSEWTSCLKYKNVIVCYDNDEVGHQGGIRVCRALLAAGCKPRFFFVDKEAGKDVTDLIKSRGPEALIKAIENASLFEEDVPEEENEQNQEAEETTLNAAYSGEYVNRRVKVDLMVAGKANVDFTFPKLIITECAVDAKMCSQCSMASYHGKRKIEIKDPSLILSLVNASSTAVDRTLAIIAGAKCKNIIPKKEEWGTLEEIAVISTVNSRDEGEYSSKRAYYIGHGIMPNASYTATGTIIPHPSDQTIVFVIDNIVPHQDSLSSFEVTDELNEMLKLFEPDADDFSGCMRKLEHIYCDFETNVTGIIGRHSMTMAMDLVFHSVLSFRLAGRDVQKGWLECLVIGDTRTGKSETAAALVAHYGLGEVISGENTSFAGMVGGLQQIGNGRWIITWGKLPMNDRRLVVVDEVSGLSIEDISRFSQVRSSGVAEISKIRTERVPARTRIIWISNPRDAKAMSSYTYGVEAIPDLIGKPEDIARFDYACGCLSSDVSSRDINTIRERKTPFYGGEQCRQLILWAWTRTPDQIVMENGVEQMIMDAAVEMGEIYSPSIPLVTSADQRIKLAKIAIAVAARLHSTHTGHEIVVKPHHVMVAVDFLNNIYYSKALSYAAYSGSYLLDTSLLEANANEVKNWISDHYELVNHILHMKTFTARDLEEMLGLYREDVLAAIQYLVKYKLIAPTKFGYEKTPVLVSFMDSVKGSTTAYEDGRF